MNQQYEVEKEAYSILDLWPICYHRAALVMRYCGWGQDFAARVSDKIRRMGNGDIADYLEGKRFG